jgi:hypothetical protein
MTSSEQQQLMEAVAGIAQSVSALLILLTEISERQAKADQEMLEVLKMISRKH